MNIGETRYLHFEGIDKPGEVTYLGTREAGWGVYKWLHPLDNGYCIEFIARGQYQDPPQDPPSNVGWASLVIDGTQLLLLWESAAMRKEDNPVELKYTYEDGNVRLWLDNLEMGSMAQSREMLAQLPNFADFLHFKQQQRGGRPKGKRPIRTIQRYEKILKLRNSQKYWLKTAEEFMRLYNATLYPGDKPITQGELSRAKRWEEEGRPK